MADHPLKNRQHQFNFGYLLIAVLLILTFQNIWQQRTAVKVVGFSEFEELLEQQAIEEVTVRRDYLEGKLKSSTAEGQSKVVAVRVEPALVEILQRYKVPYSGVRENNFLSNVLGWVMPVLLFFGVWWFLFRKIAEKQGIGGMMTIGKSQAKVYVESDTKVTFRDVAGVDEAKDELKEIIDFLKAPNDYGRLGAHIPKGILLVGPPGTGKTLLAKAVAGEAGVPFFSISGSEFVEMFVGVGAARVRDLFDQARRAAPCIIFIDELDALGRARGIGPFSGSHDEKEQTLNQLLAELDGFDTKQGIVLLAATNRPEILDPALLRAGRFDRQVLVDRPDKIGREQILNVHIKKIVLNEDVALEQIAALTPGFTGADLANLCNEAALLATRRGADKVAMQDFNNAIERIIAGLEKRQRLINADERKRVAYHEIGHAFCSLAIPGSDPVHKVSIIPRGIGSLGYTLQRPLEDRFLMTKQELLNKMTILLGGRAAESLIFGEISTGAADDLAKATDIARNMVMRYGMSENLGQVSYEKPANRFLNQDELLLGGTKQYSEETAHEIDKAVRTLIDDAAQRAGQILDAHKQLLVATAEKLIEKETLLAADLPSLH